MAWFLVVLAISAEVTATLSLKASDGFTRLGPSVVVVLGYMTSFVLLAFALRTLSVGPVYAVWSALGTIGAVLGGMLIFGERLSVLAIVGIVVVLTGVAMITMAEASA
jgi:small multidrug resistance pump